MAGLSSVERMRIGLAPELVALQEKRTANIAAKDAESEIKLNYDYTLPEGYIKGALTRAAKAPRKTPEERERLAAVEARRAYNVEARQVFKLADQNESWALDIDEVRRFAMSEQMTERLVEVMDADQDGKVQLGEWLAFMGMVYDTNPEAAVNILGQAGYVMRTRAFLEEADTIFSKFDLNDDGQLSWAEVDKFTRRPDAFGGGSDADLFMALVDTNQSETVDRAEWHTFLLGIWNKHGPEAAKGFLAMLQMSFDIPE